MSHAEENIWLNNVIASGKAKVLQDKPIVHYIKGEAIIRVGHKAIVVTTDHPASNRVTPGEQAITSTVKSWDSETGVFETENTIYVPEGV